MRNIRLTQFQAATSLKSAPRAFSLVEVVIALAIIAFGIVACMSLLNVGLRSDNTSASESAAINLIHNIIADLTNTPATSTASQYFRISPVPANVTEPKSVSLYATWDQRIVSSAADAQCRVDITYTPAVTGSNALPCSALLQVFWPPSVTAGKPVIESYVLFPPSRN